MSLSRRRLLLGAAAAAPLGALALSSRDRVVEPGVVTVAPSAIREVQNVFDAMRTVDGAGVRLKRALGGPALSLLDPFLLLDEFQSDDPNDYVAGFPDHPHRGFETVTYMVHGAMEHRDSVGNHGRLGPGSAQWMTAGRGIVHSEMPKQERGLMWGYQLWVNLPKRDKWRKPRYQDIAPERIQEVERDGARVRVVAGEVFGVRGPVDGIDVEPVFVDLALVKGVRVEHALPVGHTAFAYVMDGAVRVGEAKTEVRRGQLAVLGSGERFRADCDAERGRLLLLAGRPLGEPVARRGPFVMNTDREIEQAFEDYRSGRLVGG
jgi:redox-sensitive bicupin YhaK (pirin superfamily)